MQCQNLKMPPENSYSYTSFSRNPPSSQSSTESCRDLETAEECTRLLPALNEQDASAKQGSTVMTQAHEVDQLREQVMKLTKQVAALSNTSWNDAGKCQQPSSCSRYGHYQCDCPFRHQGSASCLCYSCGHPRNCSTMSANDQGVSVKGARYLYSQ